MQYRIVIVTVLSVAGDPQFGAAQDIRHPRDEFIVRPIAVTTELRFDVRRPQRWLATGLLRKLSNDEVGRLLSRIGLLDGAEPYVFGSIADVGIDSDGMIYVLDDRLSSVRVFSPSGKFRYSLGRSGRGPGEFIAPRAIALSRNGDVYVTDATRRIHAFRKTATAHAGGDSQNTQVPIDDLCLMGSLVVAHSRPLVRNEVIYILNDSGRVVRTFGELYRSPNNYVNMEIARGKIACAPNESIVLYSPSTVIPEIRGYDLEGRLRWVAKISGYRAIDLYQPAARPQNYRVGVPESGFHRVESALYDGHGRFIVQVAFISRATARRNHAVDRLYTFALSARDGRGSLISERLPTIGAISGARVLFIRNEPFPFLEDRQFATR